jgi:DNA-binding GntR family transcriptional regulator
VMHYTRVAMDRSGKPMEFARSVFRAEDYRFVIRVRRPNSEEE